MENDAERMEGAVGAAYDDEVLSAGWAEIPCVEPPVREVAARHHEPSDEEVAGFLARLYAAQE